MAFARGGTQTRAGGRLCDGTPDMDKQQKKIEEGKSLTKNKMNKKNSGVDSINKSHGYSEGIAALAQIVSL